MKKVLEIGVYKGASLRMWRDYFPNAMIYGADIQDAGLHEDRIETTYCDQSKETDLLALLELTGDDLDLVIDDASHVPSHQVFTCDFLMPRLKPGAVYCIEDVKYFEVVKRQLAKYHPRVYIGKPDVPDDRMLIIR